MRLSVRPACSDLYVHCVPAVHMQGVTPALSEWLDVDWGERSPATVFTGTALSCLPEPESLEAACMKQTLLNTVLLYLNSQQAWHDFAQHGLQQVVSRPHHILRLKSPPEDVQDREVVKHFDFFKPCFDVMVAASKLYPSLHTCVVGMGNAPCATALSVTLGFKILC